LSLKCNTEKISTIDFHFRFDNYSSTSYRYDDDDDDDDDDSRDDNNDDGNEDEDEVSD
jgi:hypothetical protein